MNKIFILLVVCLVVVGGIGFVGYNSQSEDVEEQAESGRFYGPVPQGYNQEHFWNTGEMILEVEE